MSSSVLVVEGYTDLCAAIAETLERRDFECDTAPTAEDAIRKLLDHRYGTILLSARLPIRDNPVMKFLRDTQPGELHKVVLMTEPEMRDDASADECRVLVKPFNNEELLATVK